MKYRKKPIVIDAFRFGYEPSPDWFVHKMTSKEVTLSGPHNKAASASIKTLEGVMRADEGDYIIRGVTGELYPCKATIFELSYEPIVEEDNKSTLVPSGQSDALPTDEHSAKRLPSLRAALEASLDLALETEKIVIGPGESK